MLHQPIWAKDLVDLSKPDFLFVCNDLAYYTDNISRTDLIPSLNTFDRTIPCAGKTGFTSSSHTLNLP